MSVYTKQSLIESYPAYNVFLRDTNSNGITEIIDGDILGLQSPKGFYLTYSVGSVVSYALEYNEDWVWIAWIAVNLSWRRSQ